MINPSVLIVLVIVVPFTVVCWWMKWMKRTTAAAVAVIAGLCVFGISAWQDTLASLVTTEDTLAALLGVIIVGGLVAWVCLVKMHKTHYHHVWIPAVMVVLGSAVGLAFGDFTHLMRLLSHAPAGTASALGQSVTAINSGRAASAMPHGTDMLAIGVALAVLVTLVVLMHRKHGAPRKGGSGQQRQLTSGGR